jgi:SNF2 family DNA or RNA helicase
VEPQAVDRAHRIGQTRPVFAYRLIARNTAEQRVLELQKTKRTWPMPSWAKITV